MNKKKIVNDPVYGFITIPDELIFDLIQHPWFQRLRRIQQLGLSNRQPFTRGFSIRLEPFI
jgi:HD superfamily phosphohydrolase